MHSDVQRSHLGGLSFPSVFQQPVPWQAEVKESTEAKAHGRSRCVTWAIYNDQPFTTDGWEFPKKWWWFSVRESETPKWPKHLGLRIYNQLPRCFGPVSICGLRHPKFTPPLTYSAFLVGDFCWPFVWKIVELKQQTMNRHLSCQNDAFLKKKLPANGNGRSRWSLWCCISLLLGFVCFLHHFFLIVSCSKTEIQHTLPETNIAPENRPSHKESCFPTIHFQVLWARLVSGRVQVDGCGQTSELYEWYLCSLRVRFAMFWRYRIDLLILLFALFYPKNEWLDPNRTTLLKTRKSSIPNLHCLHVFASMFVSGFACVSVFQVLLFLAGFRVSFPHEAPVVEIKEETKVEPPAPARSSGCVCPDLFVKQNTLVAPGNSVFSWILELVMGDE